MKSVIIILIVILLLLLIGNFAYKSRENWSQTDYNTNNMIIIISNRTDEEFKLNYYKKTHGVFVNSQSEFEIIPPRGKVHIVMDSDSGFFDKLTGPTLEDIAFSSSKTQYLLKFKFDRRFGHDDVWWDLKEGGDKYEVPIYAGCYIQDEVDINYEVDDEYCLANDRQKHIINVTIDHRK